MSIAVLDRTKEPGAIGEPLYLDVHRRCSAMTERSSWRSTAAQGDRRTLRPRLQGVYPGHGQGGLRRTGRRRAARTTSPSASMTMSPVCQPGLRPAFELEERDTVRAVFLRAWLRRHRRRQQEFHQDHRRRDRPTTARAISSTTRKRPARITISHLRFGPRPFALLSDREGRVSLPVISSVFSKRIDMLDMAEAGRGLSAQLPLRRRTRSGISCRGRCSRRSSTRSCSFYVIDA